MSNIHLRSGWLLAAAVAGLATSACGLSTEYCDAMCECELCNDRKYDECIIAIDTEIEQTDAYECTEDYEAYLQCVIDEATCDDEQWGVEGDDCASEGEDVEECIDDASDLNWGGGGTVCACTCTCTGGTTMSVCEGGGCCNGECQSACASAGYGTSLSASESCSG